MIDDELWDHYSGLPNPMWYQYIKEIDEEKMKELITFQRNMDDGYGTVYCVQKQDFDLGEIHRYLQAEEPIETVEALVAFLEEKQEDDYDFLSDLMCDLDDSEDSEHFYSIANPNGSGNNVDCLIVTYEGKVIFES